MFQYDRYTKTLTILDEFNDNLDKTDISKETKVIIFDEYSKFNQEIKKNVLPESLHTLTFGCRFNQEIKDNVLPDSLHTLRFGYYFNQEIKENVLPKSLHTFTLGYYFNQEIKENVLPSNLHTLAFGNRFNQEIKKNVLPNNLHTLAFGNRFNQEIKKNVLPNNLHTLTFGWEFNQEIKENVLPKSIKKIGLYSHCNLINNLPSHIEEIHINFTNCEILDKEVSMLPISIKKIIIGNEKNLKYITKKPLGCEIVIGESYR